MELLPGNELHVRHSCRAFSSFSLIRRKLPLFSFMTWNVQQIRSNNSVASTPGRTLSSQQTPSHSQLDKRLGGRRIPARPAGERRDARHVLMQQGTSPDITVRAKKNAHISEPLSFSASPPSPPKRHVEAIDSGKNLAVANKKTFIFAKPHASTHTEHCVRRVRGAERRPSPAALDEHCFRTDRYEHIVPDH